ncbi:MAG: MMPL family transporter [Planctomycetes bacterium]|nr:MMPL family transporter [Planctomycetota bacterium]
MIFVWIYRVTRLAPRWVAVIAAALTAACVWLASRLQFEGDVTTLLPPEDTALYREIIDRVGGSAELIILLEGDDPKALRAAAAKYKEALSAHPNVISVEYEPRLDGPLSEDLAPLIGSAAMADRMRRVREKIRTGLADQLVREDPLGIKEEVVKSAKARFKGYRFDLSDGALFSEDRKALLVVVSGRAKPHDLPMAKSTYDAALKVKVPVRVSMTGGYVVRVETEKQVKWDLIGTSAFSFVGVILLFLIGFREWRALLFASVPIVVGLVLTLGFTQLVYGHITGLSVVFAVMVVGLGIDFPIQFYNRWRAEGHVGKTLPGLGPPMLFAAITTTASIWALVPSKLPAYRELGVIGGVGVFLTLVSTLFLCPLLIPPRRPPMESRFPLSKLATRMFPLLVLVTIALALFAKRGLTYEDDYLKLAGAAPVYKIQEKVADRFGGTLDAIFFVSRSPQEARELEPRLQDLVDRGVFSGVIPAQRPLRDPDFRKNFRDAVREAGFKDTAFLEYEDWVAERLAAPSKPLLVSVGMLRERLWLREKRLEVLDALRATGAEHTGSTTLTHSLEETYRADARRATLFAAVAVLLLVALHLRHPVRVILACIPVAVGLLWTLGIMNLMEIKVNPLSATVFLLVTGIGIDNGIHLVARSREIGAEAASSELLRPMLLTSGTTMMSFGTLMFASNGMLRSMGHVLTIGIGASLAAALFFLPPILRWMRPK